MFFGRDVVRGSLKESWVDEEETVMLSEYICDETEGKVKKKKKN